MNVFYFDGSLEGLFSVVFDAYTMKRFPDALLRPHQVPPLLVERSHAVVTEREKAGRVLAGLQRKLSRDALSRFMHAWLSEDEGVDMLLYRFMRKVFDTKRQVADDFSDPDMLEVEQMAAKVRCDAHKLEGFARFQKTAEDIYVAVIGPRHNVLPLILPHFTDRFATLRFAIYDEVRGYGVFYDGRDLHDMHAEGAWVKDGRLAPEVLAEGEELFQNTWKDYCKALSIKERRNPNLQAGLMPRRFWKYMTENPRA